MTSYRWGNRTGMNLTPRTPQDLAGLSMTDTVPGVGVAAIRFPAGQGGITQAGFVCTLDPTSDDPLHFLVTLGVLWLGQQWTMARWAATRANQPTPPTAAPTCALYTISVSPLPQLEGVEGESLMPIPPLNRTDIRLLWHDRYWDGPLSGLVLYHGQKYWFKIEFEDSVATDDSIPRRFQLLQLTPEQLEAVEAEHHLFQQKVGMHTDYDEQGHRQVGAVHPLEKHAEFYNEQQKRPPLDLTYNSIIGWFIL